MRRTRTRKGLFDPWKFNNKTGSLEAKMSAGERRLALVMVPTEVDWMIYEGRNVIAAGYSGSVRLAQKNAEIVARRLLFTTVLGGQA